MANVTITAASVIPPTASSTTRIAGIAGEAIAAGETVCRLDADGLYYRADANDSTHHLVAGIAGNSAAAAGQKLDVVTGSPTLVVGTHGITVGTPLFQSATPGKICPLADLASGDWPTLVAWAVSATAFQFDISSSSAVKP